MDNANKYDEIRRMPQAGNESATNCNSKLPCPLCGYDPNAYVLLRGWDAIWRECFWYTGKDGVRKPLLSKNRLIALYSKELQSSTAIFKARMGHTVHQHVYAYPERVRAWIVIKGLKGAFV